MLGPNAKTVTLPQQNEEIPLGSMVDVVGWGRLSIDALVGSKYLQKATLSVLSPDECRNLIPEHYKESRICIKSNNSRTFKGDSGGPVLLGEGKLVGVIVNTVTIKVPEEFYRLISVFKTNIATNVSYFRDWIDEITG